MLVLWRDGLVDTLGCTTPLPNPKIRPATVEVCGKKNRVSTSCGVMSGESGSLLRFSGDVE